MKYYNDAALAFIFISYAGDIAFVFHNIQCNGFPNKTPVVLLYANYKMKQRAILYLCPISHHTLITMGK